MWSSNKYACLFTNLVIFIQVSAVKRVHEKPAAEISAVVKKKKKKNDEAKDEKPAAEVSVVVKKKKKKKDEEKAEPNEFPFQHEFLIKKEKYWH